WIVEENSINYHLWVCLKPPLGHSFIPEMDTRDQMPARPSRVRVALECICARGMLLGESLCFLHQPEDQSSFVLRTLCTGSYLDLAKVTCCVQGLVTSAWLLLPESRHCELTALPSSQSCRFQLTGPFKTDMYFEIAFAV
ncbi:IPIL1 protein, partial [Pedionomus torquatus]|nr:IPIL1 protein [Pedionomus torquatus]